MSRAVGSQRGAESASPVPLRFRLSPMSGVWCLTEETTGSMGGVFSTVAAARAFVRAEARYSPGVNLDIESVEAVGPSSAGPRS